MNRILSLFLTLVVLFVVPSCKDEDPPLPDNTVQFDVTESGLASDKAEAEIKLTLVRAVSAATNVTIAIQESGLAYGTQYTTTPAATAGQLTLTIPANSNAASFKVTKKDNVFLNGTENLTFKISSAAAPVVVGTKLQNKLTFSQILSAGTTLKLNGGEGGASAVNSVFVDFSTNTQTAVARAGWDLGFYAGADFRVIINGTTGATIKALTKTDLTQVTAADTTTLASVLVLGQGAGTFDLLDDVDGDLTRTAIKAISATDGENPVYILNPGKAGVAQKPWYKIRVIRKGTGYTLQYARITETTFRTLDVAKDANYDFNYISLTQGKAVIAEPTKGNWDIQWGLNTYKAQMDAATFVPYPYSDYVVINKLAGAQAAQVETKTVTYDAYAEANIATTTFAADRNVIGGNWRASAAPGSTAGVKTDRFYVVKDAAGNVYKLKFVNYISSDGGERGYPNIEYKLVKKAN